MKRLLIYIFIFAVMLISCIAIAMPDESDAHIEASFISDKVGPIQCQFFYTDKPNEFFSELKSIGFTLHNDVSVFSFPYNPKGKLRLDFSDRPNEHIILDSVSAYNKTQKSTAYKITEKNDVRLNPSDKTDITTTGNDAFIVIEPVDFVHMSITEMLSVYKILLCVIVSLIITFILYRYIEITDCIRLISVLISQKKLIASLTLNDFKTKYSGSYFGVIWAIIQPICQIAVYWFVFQIGLRSSAVDDVPFILWFMAGLIPWFFFSEAWGSATNVFSEYSYLVKKIVFKIDILPVIKVLSAVFIHLFFVLFMVGVFLFYGYRVDINMLGIFYYSLAMIIFTVSLSFITSSLIVFFKDLGQIVGIILQFGVWLTPIMWNINIIPKRWDFIFKANPMYYIVTGYRNSLIYKTFEFQDIKLGIYFWLITVLTFIIGTSLFNKLKPHFSDIL